MSKADGDDTKGGVRCEGQDVRTSSGGTVRVVTHSASVTLLLLHIEPTLDELLAADLG